MIVDRYDNYSNDLILPRRMIVANSNDKRKNKANTSCLEQTEKYLGRSSIVLHLSISERNNLRVVQSLVDIDLVRYE